MEAKSLPGMEGKVTVESQIRLITKYTCSPCEPTQLPRKAAGETHEASRRPKPPWTVIDGFDDHVLGCGDGPLLEQTLIRWQRHA